MFQTFPSQRGNKNNPDTAAQPDPFSSGGMWGSTPATDNTADDSSFSSPASDPFARSASSSHTSSQNVTRNVLNSDVQVIGTLRFVDDLLIDGYVEGKILSDGILSIGQNAEIKAEIHTKSVTVHGKVIGNITVTDKVELKASAELVGDIKAAQLSVESGAVFIGRSTVGTDVSRFMKDNPETDSSTSETPAAAN